MVVGGWPRAFWNVTTPVSLTIVFGVTSPSSRALAIVTSFITEPGSYWLVTRTALWSISSPGLNTIGSETA